MKKSGLIPALAIASGMALTGAFCNQSVFAEGAIYGYGGTDDTQDGAGPQIMDNVNSSSRNVGSITIREQRNIVGDPIKKIDAVEGEITSDIGCIGGIIGVAGEYKYCPYENVFTIKNAGTADSPLRINISSMGDLKIKIEGTNYFSLSSFDTGIEFIGDGIINCDPSTGLTACLDLEESGMGTGSSVSVPKEVVFNGKITYNFINDTESVGNGIGIFAAYNNVQINNGTFNMKKISNGFVTYGNNGSGIITINGGEINIDEANWGAFFASGSNIDGFAIKLGEEIKSQEKNIQLLNMMYDYENEAGSDINNLGTTFIDGSKDISCDESNDGVTAVVKDIHLGKSYTNKITGSSKKIVYDYAETDADEDIVCVIKDVEDEKEESDNNKKPESKKDNKGVGTPGTGSESKDGDKAILSVIAAGLVAATSGILVALKIKKSNKKFEYKF